MNTDKTLNLKGDGYGKDKESIDYWLINRTKLKDLYKSELYFFSKALEFSNKVLDIGCAAGGSALFCREGKEAIEYTGIDVSHNLLNAAIARFSNKPDTKFIHFDGKKIPLEDGSIDFVFSFGVFHHLNHWSEMLIEALRVSSRYFLFDLRVWDKDSLVGNKNSYQKLALGNSWDGESIISYNIISMNKILELAIQLKNIKISMKAFGYYQKPTHLAVTPADKILMLSILLEKNVKHPTFELLIE
ncbi:class I SAM-dependent methyltransferase [Polynucleobacter sp. Adler-ghost]|uniref:class I SAM-dependent methyltransferase n=1 Tax=Polynucleobacter sp. Adler-ghost TaxID=2770234 RepID=UPI001BFD32AC|nr:class I SAM-dependent methyltransferase [Polynucleobacter sp. Adler-ghost]QWE31030.1 class I SAM-dependent methyltransferase [Polynucleobacter sp. Adler-ghost]